MPPESGQRDTTIHAVWPTTLFIHRFPEAPALVGELERIIMDARDASPGISRSNIGGWHSDDSFLGQDLAPVHELRSLIDRAVRTLNSDMGVKPRSEELDLYGWANVNGPGDFNTPHLHRNCVWSGAFYVRTCEPDEGGAIAFLDPRSGSGTIVTPGAPFDKYRMLHPVVGQMVIFPSWLRHEVQPHRGSGVRITVSFNVRAG